MVMEREELQVWMGRWKEVQKEVMLDVEEKKQRMEDVD